MFTCLDWQQVNPMRFSALFQSIERQPQVTPRVEAHVELPAIEVPPTREPVAPELPEDLDARVRLVGEWQLGEAP
jgi:hypothetical protein